MKLFKKKYKRSEWFEGLLEAEELYKEGFSLNSISFELRGCTEFESGVYDFIHHLSKIKLAF